MKRSMKRVLSVVLTLGMILGSFNLNVNAEELDSESQPTEVVESVESTDNATETDEIVDAQAEDISEEDASEVESDIAEADAEKTEKKAAAKAKAAKSVVKAPENGTSSGQPFPTNIGVGHYRIPSMITTQNGTLLAAADARWGAYNHDADDTANIDTIVSRSIDDGQTWNYQFANYIADNSNARDINAAVLIDPVMVQANDGTIYMMVDLFPGQDSRGENSATKASTELGMNSDGTLRLKAAGESAYNYYLKNGKIYNSSNEEQSDYSVDDYFNLSKNGEVLGNLFTYSTTYFQPVMTSYLYMTFSKDDGKTWSAPQLLNLKKSGEGYYITSPGRGVVAADGTIIIPCYNSYNKASQASFIYSTDGSNWTRSASTGVTSSESEMVALEDGTLRMFYRHQGGSMTLCYIDAKKNGNGTYTWGSPVDTKIACHNNTNLSAIVYGKDADGKEIILVSVPGDTSGAWNRNKGRIFTLLVNNDADHTVSLANTFNVNESAYSYSCLTKLNDGSIGLLYEKGDSGNITYANYTPASQVLGSVKLPEDVHKVKDDTTGIEVDFGDAKINSMTVTSATVAALEGKKYAAYDVVPGDGYTDTPATVTMPLTEELKACTNLSGFWVDSEGNVNYVGGSKSADGNSFVYEVPHFTVTGTAEVNVKNVTLTVGESDTDTISGANYADTYTANPEGIATVKVTGTDAVEASQRYDRVTTNVTVGALANSNVTRAKTNYYYQEGSSYYPLYVTRTKGNGFFGKSYRYEYLDSYGTYRTAGNQNNVTSNTNVNIALYTMTSVDPVAASTTITFTGVNAGKASVEIGGTTYNITVNPKEEILHLLIGGTYEADVTGGGAIKTSPNAAVATAKVADGKLTITAVAEGTTTAFVGNVRYTINVTKEPVAGNAVKHGNDVVEELIISTGKQVQLTTTMASGGSYVTWESDDANVAQGFNSGLIRGGNIAGETTVYAVTYDKNDNVIAKTPVKVTVYATNKSGTTRNVTGYVNHIENTTVYYTYSVNKSTPELKELKVHTLIDITDSQSYSDIMTFFATPKEGYALTEIGAQNGSAFHQVRDENNQNKYADDTTVPDDRTDANNNYDYMYDQLTTHVYNNSQALTLNQVRTLMNQAVAKFCDGGFFFSRAANKGDIGMGNLYFYSDQLPTVKKEIISVGGKAYTEGMLANVDDTVEFKITVTEYASRQNISYGNAKLTDQLNGITLKNESKTVIENPYSMSDALTSAGEVNENGTRGLNANKKAAQTYTFYADYQIKKTDLDNEIVNVCDLEYYYKTYYSKGKYGGSATDSASITASKFEAKDLIVDFGLPVTNDYPVWRTDIELMPTGEATYGDVSVVKAQKDNNEDVWRVTYTPKQVLKGVDTVILYRKGADGQKSTPYSFKVYPATTVYYEEGFATYGNGWDLKAGGAWNPNAFDYSSATQQTQVVNGTGSYNNFGFDENASLTSGNNTSATKAQTTTRGDSLKFDFKGTGFDLFANCDNASGVITVRVKDSADKIVKMVTMDLANVGEYNSGGKAYNTPVVSIENLVHGDYTAYVSLSLPRTSGFEFDGFRVYDTIAHTDSIQNSIYDPLDEDRPDYIELRNLVLGGVTVDSTEQNYSQELAKSVGQVYDANDVTSAKQAVVSYDNGGIKTGTTAEALLKVGPKNELYLWNGMSVTFKINTKRAVQIGLRSVDGTTLNYSVKTGAQTESKELSSSVDMFYSLKAKTADEKETTYTITNNSDGILSITDLKVCDAVAADILGELTVDDVVNALTTEAKEEPTVEPEPTIEPTYADATLNVVINDNNGKALATTTLTANGIEGETATFAAADIQAAVEGLSLPSGYELKATYEDKEVVYGEVGEVTFTATKQAVAPQKPKNIFQRVFNTISNIIRGLFGRR